MGGKAEGVLGAAGKTAVQGPHEEKGFWEHRGWRARQGALL